MFYKSPILNAFQWTLEISIQNDFKNRIYNELQRAGYKDATEKDAVYQYYNLRKRRIEPKPRTVMYSKEFACPAGYEKAMEEFTAKIKNGEDLMPFQSQKIQKSEYNDLLLNDWGIQHFHLTRRFRDDGFAARSQFQIFAYVTEDRFYLIQAYPHDAADLYSKQKMVRILRDNWPEITERFRAEGITHLTEKLDDHAYARIREAHILSLLELGENEVYYPIGGGYSSTGLASSALWQADYWLNRLALFQKLLVDHGEQLGQLIRQMSGHGQQRCDMKLRLLWIDSADKVTLFESNTGLIVQPDLKERRIRVCMAHELLEPKRTTYKF